ncbi:hypothetical protein FS837_002122 [Tulasnella sp. UAMH 9824]|nr:hypothetical protein FS837_002122 [Tulasnella sp. UAMH 9824]
MSHINALPFDVFQIIITSCWEEKGESFARAASHVCRLWRRHVLDMPLLWNRLEFARNTPQWDMLEVNLARSGQAPLDIVIKEKVFLKSGMPHLRPGTLDTQAEQFIQLVFRIISASPALQVLSLFPGPDSDYENEREDVEHSNRPPVTHSFLQLLHIPARTSVRDVILRSLILPKLRSLGEPIVDTEIDVLCCKTLAQSNAPGPRGVIIKGSHDPVINSHTPSLPSAFMSLQYLVVVVFRFIDFGGNNKWLPNLGDCCPRLKSLTVLYCTGFTVKPIQAIIETRMRREEMDSLDELRIYPSCGRRDYVPSNEQAAWFSRVLEFNMGSWYVIDGYDM